jgi:hypothetical protein
MFPTEKEEIHFTPKTFFSVNLKPELLHTLCVKFLLVLYSPVTVQADPLHVACPEGRLKEIRASCVRTLVHFSAVYVAMLNCLMWYELTEGVLDWGFELRGFSARSMWSQFRRYEPSAIRCPSLRRGRTRAPREGAPKWNPSEHTLCLH